MSLSFLNRMNEIDERHSRREDELERRLEALEAWSRLADALPQDQIVRRGPGRPRKEVAQ